MELHNDEVPSDEVWAVVIDSPVAQNVDWYITAAESRDAYHRINDWYEHNEHEWDVRVTRWYIELPKQRMDRYDVDIFVNTAINGGTGHDYGIRLDVKSHKATSEVGA